MIIRNIPRKKKGVKPTLFTPHTPSQTSQHVCAQICSFSCSPQTARVCPVIVRSVGVTPLSFAEIDLPSEISENDCVNGIFIGERPL
jgi:hypothetical protein